MVVMVGVIGEVATNRLWCQLTSQLDDGLHMWPTGTRSSCMGLRLGGHSNRLRENTYFSANTRCLMSALDKSARRALGFGFWSFLPTLFHTCVPRLST